MSFSIRSSLGALALVTVAAVVKGNDTLGPRILIFRRANGNSGPVTELRVSMPGAHIVLKKQ